MRQSLLGAALLFAWAMPALSVPPLAAPGAARFGIEDRLQPGKLLVAAEHLRDPNFAESVVLLVTYDSRGAMGLVVNHPTGMSLEQLLPEVEDLSQPGDALFRGGPVAPWALMMLVRAAEPVPGGRAVLDDVFFSADRDVLERLLRGQGTDALLQARLFAGHSGWAPGQLEAEVGRGDWHIFSGEGNLVFDVEPSALWSKLMLRVGALRASVGRGGPRVATPAPGSDPGNRQGGWLSP